MKPNRTQLIDLMFDHNIRCQDAARYLDVKESTVKVWRCKSGIDIPTSKLELLTFKVLKDAT